MNDLLFLKGSSLIGENKLDQALKWYKFTI